MDYDLFVIGGGINGCGIARDAAGRGLTVGLCERDDLGAHTSSASTKLVHGGLRYLEHYEFGLVRSALREREVLWANAPHIIWPLRFVLPHHSGLRPAWYLRLGLFLYDHLGGRRELPATKTVKLTAPPFEGQLRAEFTKGFEYSDAWVEDSRLVVLNAADAAARGADIMPHTACTGLHRRDDHWQITLQDKSGHQTTRSARMIINAAGPWVANLANMISPSNAHSRVRLVKGSHIVVKRLYDGDHAYIFQNADGRIVFAIPYERDFTLIGTTDVPVDTPEDGRSITQDEIDYLCRLASDYFSSPITPDDVVWTYAGVRPLYDDAEGEASKVTRDYRFELNDKGPPALSVYGGKITTYRKLAEAALARLERHLPPEVGAPWTATAPLPGGDLGQDRKIEGAFEAYMAQLDDRYLDLPPSLLQRLARAYGSRAEILLGEARSLDDLGICFGADLYEREVAYLCDHEFASSADDILWRRSKLGLRLSGEEANKLSSWLQTRASDSE